MHLLTIKKNSTNNLGLTKVNALPPIRQPDRVVRKARDWAAADYRHQTKGKIMLCYEGKRAMKKHGTKQMEIHANDANSCFPLCPIKRN